MCGRGGTREGMQTGTLESPQEAYFRWQNAVALTSGPSYKDATQPADDSSDMAFGGAESTRKYPMTRSGIVPGEYRHRAIATLIRSASSPEGS